jgi:UDP-galactopyranose mutase
MQAPRTVICREYPQEYGPGRDACYPVNNAANQALYARYRERAAALDGVHFCGRLGLYSYLDMDMAVKSALELFATRLV